MTVFGRFILLLIAPLCLSSCLSQCDRGKETGAQLIPRAVLFGNPDKTSVKLSPDGSKISYLAPVEGVLNVWVGPSQDPSQARPVTQDKTRGIRRYDWAFTNQHIVYLQDKGGDEDWHLYSVNLQNSEVKDLTPFEKIAARIQNISPKFPDEILVEVNNRDPKYHDVFRINVSTGIMALVQKNDGFGGFLSDDDFGIRLAQKSTPDGGYELLAADGAGGFKQFIVVGQEDAAVTSPWALDKSGEILYMLDSRGRNTAALKSIDIATKEEKLLGENEKADVSDIMLHPTQKHVEAFAANYERVKWTILDESLNQDFTYLARLSDGELRILSRSLDDSRWIVTFFFDDKPARYYSYDRKAKKADFLFTDRSELEKYSLAKMQPVVIPSRDGLNLVSYLTLPNSEKIKGLKPEKPVPMVLLVHGGPWARDVWGYNSNHQWLANRGYAVLSVNFRASTGFGKAFVNAGDRQWSKKMHDDLIDAVDWAVAQGIAQKDKVAIMGGSYGGYATLAGLTFTPDVFACGVDIVGPSNLITLLETVPPYWASFLATLIARVGDHRTEEGRKELTAASPLTYVDRIKKPLLIGQGANDPRVKQAESDQIVEAMTAKNIPVTYVLYPDEGHGFARPPNRQSFMAVAEAFLSKHLGGRFEPIGGDFAGASITVPKGKEFIPGLGEALRNQ